LGTPRLITDDTATPVWQWPYSAFGETKPTGLVQIAGSGATQSIKGTTATFEFNLRYPGQYADSETGQFYNYYRNYLAAQGRYTQNDPIGLAGGMNRFAYVHGNPLSFTDPEGLQVPGSWNTIFSRPGVPSPGQATGAVGDFNRNYRDMREANTINADKYFHCKANCEASRRGTTGNAMACLISDSREWFDQTVKRDPTSASIADQAANQYGRNNSGAGGTCEAVCSPYRPRGLPSWY
jgi:RHS repeat-associated protein